MIDHSVMFSVTPVILIFYFFIFYVDFKRPSLKGYLLDQ